MSKDEIYRVVDAFRVDAEELRYRADALDKAAANLEGACLILTDDLLDAIVIELKKMMPEYFGAPDGTVVN